MSRRRSISTRPACSAGFRASPGRPSSAVAARISESSLPSSAAATSNAARVGSGSCSTWRRNTPCRRMLNGMASGSGTRPASCASERPAGSSSRARGLPAASVIRRSRTDAASSRRLCSSSSMAAPSSSPPRTSSGSPGACNCRRSPSRAANSTTIPSAARRRAANISASADGTSSHWASSITHSTGPSSAAAARSDRTPAETRKRSVSAAGASPSAAATAAR